MSELQDLTACGLAEKIERREVSAREAAELCAKEFRFTREAQDVFAHESYRRAREAQKSGRFAEEIAPVELGGKKGEVLRVTEDDESVLVTYEGGDLGLLIGRHGQTIDAIQHLVNAIVLQRPEAKQKLVTVDAAGYRERRQALLESLAARSAERVRSLGQPVELAPMSALERRIVHLRLKEEPGVSTRSEGDEPHRYVVVEPV